MLHALEFSMIAAIGVMMGSPGLAGEGLPENDPHRRGSTLYVTDRASGEVIALSRDGAEVIAVIAVGRSPMGIAGSRGGDRLYVACAGSHTIAIIDGATRKVLDTLALTHGAVPTHVALGPREARLYVSAQGTDSVHVFDTGSLQEVADIPVSRKPTRLALSPDGSRLYVLCVESGRVDIVDTLRGQVIASPTVGSRPSDIGLDPFTGTVFVSHSAAPLLHSLVEGASQAEEIGIEAPAEALAVDGSGRRVFLAVPLLGRILLLAPGAGASTTAFSVEDVTRMVVDPEGKTLYSLSARRGVLSYVNRIVGTVEKTVPAGKEPWDLALIP